MMYVQFLVAVMNLVWMTMSEKCHDNDCSQGKLFDGDDEFECKIRNLKGWESFQRRYNVKENYTTDSHLSFMPPLITAVNWYTIPILQHNTIMYNPALNITFSLQFGKESGFYAVLLKFESPGFENVTDEFFHSNPRYRIFDFHKYSPNYYDRSYKRKISYNCIWGLANGMRVYFITLTGYTTQTTTPGVSITYQMTTYKTPLGILNRYPDIKIWKSTIITAYYPERNHIYVVFEPAPVRVQYHKVELLKLGEDGSFYAKTSQTIYFGVSDYECIFENNESGTYKIKILVYGGNCSGVCSSTESYHLIIQEEARGTSGLRKYVFILIGVTAGILLMCLLLCAWKIRDSRKIILMEVCGKTASRNITRVFAKYLNYSLKSKISISNSLLSENSPNPVCFHKVRTKLNCSKRPVRRSIVIILCDCHLDNIVNILQSKTINENVSFLTENVHLINLGNLLMDTLSELLENHNVLDFTKDEKKLYHYIDKSKSDYGERSSNPYFETLMGLIHHSDSVV